MLSQMFRRRGAGPMLHTSSMSIGERSTIGTSIFHALQGSAMALAFPDLPVQDEGETSTWPSTSDPKIADLRARQVTKPLKDPRDELRA